jgi:hypothetical protein
VALLAPKEEAKMSVAKMCLSLQQFLVLQDFAYSCHSPELIFSALRQGNAVAQTPSFSKYND